MNPTAIFWLVIAHVVLVGMVYAVLGQRRFAALRDGSATVADFRDRSSAEPARSATASANLMNQFELPVLFHVVCLSLFVTAGVSYMPLALAWLFILSRYGHAWIHLATANIRHRHHAFVAGVVLLSLLWIWFALHLLAVV